MDPATPDPVAALERRTRGDGARPLVTWYDGAGARVELSGTTFANWADKIANLAADRGLQPGDAVGGAAIAARPAHWVGLVWVFGCWQAGLVVDLEGAGGLTIPPFDALGLSQTEVLGQPDLHWRAPRDPGSIAWRAGTTELTVADLGSVTPDGARRLVAAGEPWPTVARLVAAVLGGGSVVMVEGVADPTALARIAADERAVT